MDTFSQQNVERIQNLANEFREKHGAMKWGIAPEVLLELEGIKCEEYDLAAQGFFARIRRSAIEIGKKIKAALLPHEKIVFIDADLHHARKPFGKNHELGHQVIPEHKEILYVCSEHDLSPGVRTAMEFEANVFAAESLYPRPLLEKVHTNYPLSMESILQLKDLAGGSIHSAAIKYAETSDKSCCLLVLKEEYENKELVGLRLIGQQASTPFMSKYGRCVMDHQLFPINHTLSRVVVGGSPEEFIQTHISMHSSKIKFQAHVFFNKYRVFALIFDESY